MKNKFKSLFITLILLMIATYSAGGRIQLNNIFQISITMLMYIGIIKFFVFIFKHIQNLCNEVENILHNQERKKYNN